MKRVLPVSIAVAALLMAGCGPKPAAEPPPPPSGPPTTTLAAGTPIDLILMQNLQSGRSKEGAPVTLMVAEDVRDSAGLVVIRRGELAKGAVKWSRGQDTLDALSNRPPRLTITLDSTTAVDGTTVALTAYPSTKPETAYIFDRGNTGKQLDSATLDALLKDPATGDSLKKLAQMFADGDTSGFEQTPEAKEALKRIANELGMPGTRTMVDRDQLDQVQKLLGDLRSGGAVAALATGGGAAALTALSEMAHVAGEVTDKIGGMLKGRSIKAYLGTHVKANTTEAVTVKLPQ